MGLRSPDSPAGERTRGLGSRTRTARLSGRSGLWHAPELICRTPGTRTKAKNQWIGKAATNITYGAFTLFPDALPDSAVSARFFEAGPVSETRFLFFCLSAVARLFPFATCNMPPTSLSTPISSSASSTASSTLRLASPSRLCFSASRLAASSCSRHSHSACSARLLSSSRRLASSSSCRFRSASSSSCLWSSAS